METMKNLTVACLKQVIKPRPKQSHKGIFGKILIIGGNKNMGGAVIMSASATVLSPVPQIVQIFLHFMRAYLKQWSSIIATLRL